MSQRQNLKRLSKFSNEPSNIIYEPCKLYQTLRALFCLSLMASQMVLIRHSLLYILLMGVETVVLISVRCEVS